MIEIIENIQNTGQKPEMKRHLIDLSVDGKTA
jgi:hypothetical protein